MIVENEIGNEPPLNGISTPLAMPRDSVTSFRRCRPRIGWTHNNPARPNIVAFLRVLSQHECDAGSPDARLATLAAVTLVFFTFSDVSCLQSCSGVRLETRSRNRQISER